MRRPSFHAPLSDKTSPINSDLEIDLGLILYSLTPLITSSYSKAKTCSISSLVLEYRSCQRAIFCFSLSLFFLPLF